MDTSCEGIHGFVLEVDDPTIWAGGLKNQGREMEFVAPLLENGGSLTVHPLIRITKAEFDSWSSIQTNSRMREINKNLSFLSKFIQLTPPVLLLGVVFGMYQGIQFQSMFLFVFGVCSVILVLLAAIFFEGILRKEKKKLGDEKEKALLRSLIREKKLDGRLIHLLDGPTKFALVVE